MAKKNPVEIVVIVDRSGSMSGVRAEAIGGYNAFLAEQKKVKGAANLTLVLFDHEYTVPYASVPIEHVPDLNNETYQPRGMTALNDAIGRSLAALEMKAPKHAIICVLTDGQENSSKEFTISQVRERIKSAEARGWQVQYLSSDLNAVRDASQYGVASVNTVQFKNDGAGMRSATQTLSVVNTNYRNLVAK
jgi:uncharacterized protein with von Willebrand factor type A (vWA) domain